MPRTADADTPASRLTVTSCCAPTESAGDESAQALASMFKALSDPARVKILSMLLNADEVCACDVSTAIGKSAATTSHHLKILRGAGLVASERRGTWVYYRVVPERWRAVGDALGPRS